MNIPELIRTNNLQDLQNALTTNPSLANLPDERGFTPLVLATYLGQKEVAEVLLDHGAELDAQDPMMGNTALMGVCFKGSLELAQLLIARGADKSLKNKNGETALDFARKGGFEEIVEVLK